ncbi:DNA recombination protein RmuC [Shewanella intestini]|uniref:DNA recombination protein RmuC n=1 Tax=Shewanella intestini TaxID=2017544 RepID=A0ABS5I7C6_9GAMM|nr:MULTISPECIES: DNA recombination protein RmuC [Shewanella]MBR9729230.1 DNA recombination protein RmuC [Shewanella intestini]MRG35375.1 DNA recombination protein RmuC [Shewanella sp. XMDDZSB0408]
MPVEISFTPIQFAAIAAVAFIAFLLGMLINQRLTRQRWEQVKAAKEAEHEQQLTQALAQVDLLQHQLDDKQDNIHHLQQKVEQLVADVARATADAQRLNKTEEHLAQTQHKLMEAQLNLSKSNAMQLSIKAQAETQQQALHDKVALLESAEQRLKEQFENLANRIFEERTENFKKQNVDQMDGVLGPLKQQLDGFRQQILTSYNHEQSERSALKHQLDHLRDLNLKMSQDAINLTNALKGDNKQQGNWGEVILERVLQESGLREGHEYATQQQLKDDAGKRFKPDIIVHLPQHKDVVIDAKISLIAYERYFNSDDDLVSQQALKEHAISIRQHIKGLSQKDYQQLHGVKSLDYVLMFIPIEPAFLLAIEHDPSLVNFALEHNIMLVSPTNLLVALRTINNIWRYEYQNQNAQAIAKQAGRIYDKLCGYLDDMEKLGRALETADKTYQTAMGKLSTGKGNVIRQAHVMQQLGVETSKQLDSVVLQQALDESIDKN